MEDVLKWYPVCCKRWYEAKRIVEILGMGRYGYAYPSYKYIYFCPVCGREIDEKVFAEYVRSKEGS